MAAGGDGRLIVVYNGGTVAASPAVEIYGSLDGGAHWTLEESGGYVPVPTHQLPAGPAMETGAIGSGPAAAGGGVFILVGARNVAGPRDSGSAPTVCETGDVDLRWSCPPTTLSPVALGIPDAGGTGAIVTDDGARWAAVVHGRQVIVGSTADRGRSWVVRLRLDYPWWLFQLNPRPHAAGRAGEQRPEPGPPASGAAGG